jgi:MtN3 and saliva related transmembrane protein
MSHVADLIGALAGLLTAMSFVPQVVRSWQRRSASDFSMVTLLAFTAGITLWLTYGVLTRSLAVIVSNTVTLVLALALLGMKIRFG